MALRSTDDTEMKPLHDADVVTVKEMYTAIRELKTKLVVNVHQSTNLCTRLFSVLSTLLKMPSPRPSPELVSVVRSTFHLFRILSDQQSSWHFIMLHFTGKNIFSGLRNRLARAWTLFATASWEADDDAALKKDEAQIIEFIHEQRMYGRLPPTGIRDAIDDPAHLLSLLRRRSNSSGWKLVKAFMETAPNASVPQVLRETTASISGWDMEADVSIDTSASLQRHTTRSEASFYRGTCDTDCMVYLGVNVAITELPSALCEPEDLEAFVVGAVHRFSWFHPSLVQFYGAFTEALTQEGGAVLSFGIVEEDLLQQGFARLDNVLFDNGERMSIHNAVNIGLKVADALQYIREDAADLLQMPRPALWSWIPPSGIFFRDDNATLPALASAERWMGSSKLDVKVSPPFFSMTRFSRWQPPSRSVCPEAYSIGLLMIAMVTNQPPYAHVTDQIELAGSIEACALPFSIPRTIPFELQRFCAKALATESENGFKSTRECRLHLMALHDLGKDFATVAKHSNVAPVAVDDFGGQ